MTENPSSELQYQIMVHIMAYAIRVVAGDFAQRRRKPDSAFNKGTDGRVGQAELQVGVDGQGVDVSLLHVFEQAAMLAIAGIIFRADAQVGDVTYLVFSHAAYAEMIGDFVHEDGPQVADAQIAKDMETERPHRAIAMFGMLWRTWPDDGSSWHVTITRPRWTRLCHSGDSQGQQEAQG